MRIDQLPAASTIGNTDTLPFSDGGITKQISVGNLTNSIRDNVYGAPLTASISSAMTDTSRVYVYTGTTGSGFTNGHWYYYNGSAWTDGGIYNSAAVQTDPTLTLEGVPADAKATGELKTVIDDKLAEFDVAVETFYPHDGYNGPIVTVEGTVDAPPAELVIYGMSLQEGATPSPSAPVDIVTAGSGGTLRMVSAGKNLVDYHAITPSGANATVTEVENGVRITCTRGEFAGGSIVERCRVPGTYTLSFDATVNLLAQGGNRIGFRHGDTNTFINAVTCETSGHYKVTATINVPFYLTFAVSRATSAAGDVTFTNIMLVRESNEAEYVPYVGITSAIPTPNGLPGIPVASGGNYIDSGETRWICDTIDFKAGIWTKRCGIIDSYNGETLPGVWMSSKDVYVSGNSPTIGATVVYALATPLVVQLSEEQLTALRALRGRKGQTVMYSPDPVVPEFPVTPEFLAEMYIDIPTYIQSLLNQMDREFNVTAVNNGLEFTSIE